jgi:hypothetical protein
MSSKTKTSGVKNTPKKKRGANRRSSKASTSVGVPMAISKTIRGTIPSVTSGRGGITVVHNEFWVQYSTGSGADDINYWTIQPTWTTMFPWLAHIARNYERYEFTNLEFTYVPRVPTTTVGEVVLVVDPDPADEVPAPDIAGKAILLSHVAHSVGSAWKELTVKVPNACLRERGYLFTAHPESEDDDEPRTTHFGHFIIGTFGCPANTVLGDFFVSYTIQFHFPQLCVPIPTSGPQGSRVGTNVLSSTGQFANAESVGQTVRNLTSIAAPATLTAGSSQNALYEAVLHEVTTRLYARLGLNPLSDAPPNSRTYYEGLVTFTFVFRTNSGTWPADLTIRAQLHDGGTNILPVKSTFFSYSPLVSGANLFGVTFQCDVWPNLWAVGGNMGIQVLLESASFASGNWYGDVSRFYVHFDGALRYASPGAKRSISRNRPLSLAEHRICTCRHASLMDEMELRAAGLCAPFPKESCESGSVKGRR